MKETRMINSIALYLNLENTLLPREIFPTLMGSGQESYFTAIKNMDSRVCLVAPAKDWILLAISNPKLIDILKKKGVVIFPTLFSHVLPDTFPETLEAQYALSSKILKKLFERIFWHGIIPENAMSSIIAPYAVKHWDGAILSVGHNNLRGLQFGYYDLETKAKCRLPLRVIGNTVARLKYMRMYRSEIEPSEVFESMGANNPIYSCLFDFERPWSNIVYYPHSGKSPARMDIWQRFHRGLASKDVASWELPDIPNRQPLFLNEADRSMWENKESNWLIDIQREAMTQCVERGDYFELAALCASSCMPPRVLTRFMRNDSFPSVYGEKKGIVDLVGDVSKVKELLFICKNIQQKRRVDYGVEFLPKGERLYLELLHKALIWAEQHIL